MKLIGNFTGKLFACVTALAFVAIASETQAQSIKQGSAKVSQVRGSAQYSGEAGVWVPLKRGTVLKPGTTVRTGAESIVDLNLGVNGPMVRVTPNTTVGLDKLTHTGTGIDSVIETTVNVQNGTIIGSVKKLAKASKYEIKTPNGVAGIRGTDYVVSVKELADGTFQVTFTDITGTLVVAAVVNGNSEIVVLNEGESWTPGNDVFQTPAALVDFYLEQLRQAGRALEPVTEAVVSTPRIEPHISPTLGTVNGNGNGEGNGSSNPTFGVDSSTVNPF